MRRIWQWLGLLAIAWAAAAQGQHYPFVQAAPSVAPGGCLFPFEDSRGRLWLAGCLTGTEGLFYFDGTRYIAPLKSGFPSGLVRGMTEDSEGGIWISSTAGIFRLFNGKLETIVSGLAEAGIERIGPDIFLAAIGKSANEATATADAVRIRKTRDGWKAETIVPSLSQVQFRLDASGHILYGCEGGYCELQQDQVMHWHPGGVLSIIRHSVPGDTDYMHNAAIVYRDHSGCVWLRNNTQAAYQCTSDPRPIDIATDVVSGGFPRLLELPDGSIVIGSLTRLAIGRPGHFQVMTAKNGYPGMLPEPDRAGNLWLSCAKGLFYFPWRMHMEFWSESEGLEGSPFSVLPMSGRIFAAAGGALQVLSPDRQHWRVLQKLGDIQHLAEGPQGTLLASSATQGVLQLSKDGTIVGRSIPANVQLIRHGGNGQLWAVGDNVWSVTVHKAHVNLAPQITGVAGVGHDVKVDAAGSPWACYGNAIFYRDSLKWDPIAKAQGLLAEGCSSLSTEPNGDIWYADSIRRSLYLIQQPKSARPQIRQFQSGGDVGTALGTFLETDRRGWLWRGSSDGIYVADSEQARQGEWIHLDLDNGLPALRANVASFREDADGSVWYCADSAIVHFFPPADLLHPKYAPSVFLSTFASNGEEPQPADTLSGIKSGADLSIHIGSLQFDRRDMLRLRYRVLPEQQTWNAGRDLDLHLGKLRWGSHTLQVEARLGDGPWSVPVEHSVSVLRPAWLSWPVLLLFGAGSGGTVTGLSRWKKRQRLRKEWTLPDISAWRMSALSPDTEHLIGTVVDGRYEIGHILSVGGLATVARARDLRQDGRLCAVKIFRYEVADQAWMQHRFAQEVKALEQLSHPNIVKITGHGKVDTGAPYLVMEFIHGRSLRELLSGGPLPPKQISAFLRQAVSALAALHARAIYHRDLKPDNMMIRADAENAEQLVLIDFSIAIVKSPDKTIHGISRVAGTLGYMAPEQVIGYADSSTDLHALAKIVVEMLTGSRWTELMPEGTLDMAAFLRHYLANKPCGLSHESIVMLAAALAFDPHQRPQSVVHFGDPIIRDLAGIA